MKATINDGELWFIFCGIALTGGSYLKSRPEGESFELKNAEL